MYRSSTGGKKQPPNPDRFKDFTLVEDDTGFKIQGSDHVFYFDRQGGWFDEFENYYNADGRPDRPPSDDGDDDEFEDYDRLAAEYDDGDDDYDNGGDNYDDLFRIAENKKKILLYQPDHDVEAEVENINFKVDEKQFKTDFAKNFGINFASVEFYRDENKGNRFTGTALVVLDAASCSKLVDLQGTNYAGRDLRIFVLKPPKDDEEDYEAEDIVHDVPVIINSISEPLPVIKKEDDTKKPSQQQQAQQQPAPKEETKERQPIKFTNANKFDKKDQAPIQQTQQQPQQQIQAQKQPEKPAQTSQEQSKNNQQQQQQKSQPQQNSTQSSSKSSQPEEVKTSKAPVQDKVAEKPKEEPKTQTQTQPPVTEEKPKKFTDPNAFSTVGWGQLPPKRNKKSGK